MYVRTNLDKDNSKERSDLLVCYKILVRSAMFSQRRLDDARDETNFSEITQILKECRLFTFSYKRNPLSI